MLSNTSAASRPKRLSFRLRQRSCPTQAVEARLTLVTIPCLKPPAAQATALVLPSFKRLLPPLSFLPLYRDSSRHPFKTTSLYLCCSTRSHPVFPFSFPHQHSPPQQPLLLVVHQISTISPRQHPPRPIDLSSVTCLSVFLSCFPSEVRRCVPKSTPSPQPSSKSSLSDWVTIPSRSVCKPLPSQTYEPTIHKPPAFSRAPRMLCDSACSTLLDQDDSRLPTTTE